MGSKCLFSTIMFTNTYNGTKPGAIRKISFQATNRKLYLTILYNRYVSTGPKMSFGVLKGIKMPIFYNNVYKTPINGTNLALWGIYHFRREIGKYILSFFAIGIDLLVPIRPGIVPLLGVL